MTQRPLYEQHVSGPALAAFLRVSAAWALEEPQERMLLGQPAPETLRSWKTHRTGALSLDQVERISYVLRIFRLLQERQSGVDWLPGADLRRPPAARRDVPRGYSWAAPGRAIPPGGERANRRRAVRLIARSPEPRRRPRR
jgi:hypothetical protein